MKKFDVIMSLGADCACAMYMKKHVMRTFSSPFDWLTHADFETRMNLILNDFEPCELVSISEISILYF